MRKPISEHLGLGIALQMQHMKDNLTDDDPTGGTADSDPTACQSLNIDPKQGQVSFETISSVSPKRIIGTFSGQDNPP